MLLQVKAQVSHRSSKARQAPWSIGQTMDPATRQCHDALCGGRKDMPFGGDELFEVVATKWDWLTAYCKLENKWTSTVSHTWKGACLWKGCLADRDLVKGASDYLRANPWNPDEAEYCFREHCSNAQFDLHTTTPSDAQDYCDKKFGDKWRRVTAGPDGHGWPDEEP